MKLSKKMQMIVDVLNGDARPSFTFKEMTALVGSTSRGVASSMKGLWRRSQYVYCRRVTYGDGTLACLE